MIYATDESDGAQEGPASAVILRITSPIHRRRKSPLPRLLFRIPGEMRLYDWRQSCAPKRPRPPAPPRGAQCAPTGHIYARSGNCNSIRRVFICADVIFRPANNYNAGALARVAIAELLRSMGEGRRNPPMASPRRAAFRCIWVMFPFSCARARRHLALVNLSLPARPKIKYYFGD